MGVFRDLLRAQPWVQGMLIFCAGAFLAVSGCFGFFLSGADATSTMSGGAAGLFVVGVVVLLVGFVWFMVGLLLNLTRRRGQA